MIVLLIGLEKGLGVIFFDLIDSIFYKNIHFY
jgi:hypothetical protein